MEKRMTYAEQLRDERWLSVRDRIIERDMHVCTQCLRGKNLQVHHRYYEDGKMAWEYPDSALVTLCRLCHAIEHGKITELDYDTRKYHECRPIKSIREVMIDFIEIHLKKING